MEVGWVAGSDEDGAVAEAGADESHQVLVMGHSGGKSWGAALTGEEDMVGHAVEALAGSLFPNGCQVGNRGGVGGRLDDREAARLDGGGKNLWIFAGNPEVQGFARCLQGGKAGLDCRIGDDFQRWIMQQEGIDVADFQALQAPVEAVSDISGGMALPAGELLVGFLDEGVERLQGPGQVAVAVTGLGYYHEVITAALQGLAKQGFTTSRGVRVGGVDDRNADFPHGGKQFADVVLGGSAAEGGQRSGAEAYARPV